MEINCDSTEYSKTTTARGQSTEHISLVEVGQGAQSQLQHLTQRDETKGRADRPESHDSSTQTTGEVQPKDSLPQIRELDRIFQEKDGDAFREFVLLGSPAGQESLDVAARQV